MAPLMRPLIPLPVSQSGPAAASHRASPTKPSLTKKQQELRLTYSQVIISLSNVQRGLAHVQNGLNDLMTAYIKHTASVLAGEEGALESLHLPSDVADTANSAMAAATFAINNVAHAVAPPPANAVDTGKNKKRKREKKEKDPNAPKRPLTAAFLYAQAARPVVKKDLEAELAPGQKLESNAVQLEVTKRWNEMTEEEKEVSHTMCQVYIP
jgi:transcriptional regulator HMO1